MSGNYMQDKDGNYIPAIPEPFWERSLRTWFRWKPMCCSSLFKNRQEYDFHYVTEHLKDEKPGD